METSAVSDQKPGALNEFPNQQESYKDCTCCSLLSESTLGYVIFKMNWAVECLIHSNVDELEGNHNCFSLENGSMESILLITF